MLAVTVSRCLAAIVSLFLSIDRSIDRSIYLSIYRHDCVVCSRGHLSLSDDAPTCTIGGHDSTRRTRGDRWQTALRSPDSDDGKHASSNTTVPVCIACRRGDHVARQDGRESRKLQQCIMGADEPAGAKARRRNRRARKRPWRVSRMPMRSPGASASSSQSVSRVLIVWRSQCRVCYGVSCGVC